MLSFVSRDFARKGAPKARIWMTFVTADRLVRSMCCFVVYVGPLLTFPSLLRLQRAHARKCSVLEQAHGRRVQKDAPWIARLSLWALCVTEAPSAKGVGPPEFGQRAAKHSRVGTKGSKSKAWHAQCSRGSLAPRTAALLHVPVRAACAFCLVSCPAGGTRSFL